MVLFSKFSRSNFSTTGLNTHWVFFPVSLCGDRPGNTLFGLLLMQSNDVTLLTSGRGQPIGGRRSGREGRHPVTTAGGNLQTAFSRSRCIANMLK